MATLKELHEQQARIATNARAKFEEITDETPEERAAEIEREYDAMMADYDKLGAKAERLKRLEDAEKALDAPDPRAVRGEDVSARAVDDGKPMDYRDAFQAFLRNGASLGGLEPEARKAMAEKRAQTTANAAGGYSIPEQMLEEIVVAMKAWGPMYSGAPFRDIVTTGGNPMPFPTIDDTAVTAEAHTEGATMTDDGGKDATFDNKQLDAYAFDTEWLRISKELMDDSFLAMQTFISGILGERLARLANAQLTTGTGSSAPNGIVTASSLGKTAVGAIAITSDEILDLEHSVDPAYRTGGSVGYMFNDSTLNAIRKLKDGQGNYLWQQGNIQAGVPGTLNGRPYWINQDMPSLAASSKVMLFGDMSKYFVRKVGAPLMLAIQDSNFAPGVGVAGYIRFDGELSDTRAVKHLITAAS
ncbi:phage major capsid protein [Dinoroseobacter sp. S375]|uniref:phage major capsid protein n=1 Tax=Dinoroseobacter sp. S375 TaxID=3415136 RepID=UPI003C7E12A4